MELFLPIITTLIGGLIALAGVYLSNFYSLRARKIERSLDAKRAQAELLRNYGEDLYSNFSKWSVYVFASHASLYPVMRGEITYNDHYDQQFKLETQGFDHHRTELIIRAYFPALIEQYQMVQSALREHNDVVLQHRNAYKEGVDGSRFLTPFQQAQVSFEREAEHLKNLIVSELSKLSH